MPQRQSSSGAGWSFGFFRHGAKSDRWPPVQEATSGTAGSHTDSGEEALQHDPALAHGNTPHAPGFHRLGIVRNRACVQLGESERHRRQTWSQLGPAADQGARTSLRGQ